MVADELVASRELDWRIAEQVMGCHIRQHRSSSGRMLYDLVIPDGVNQVDFVDADGAGKSCPAYSTDISAAIQVAEKMRLAVIPFVIYAGNGLEIDRVVWAAIQTFQSAEPSDVTGDGRDERAFVTCVDENVHQGDLAETAPLAICRAALRPIESHQAP